MIEVTFCRTDKQRRHPKDLLGIINQPTGRNFEIFWYLSACFANKSPKEAFDDIDVIQYVLEVYIPQPYTISEPNLKTVLHQWTYYKILHLKSTELTSMRETSATRLFMKLRRILTKKYSLIWY